MKVLLDNKKPFFKANLHAHSTYSDGKLTPPKLKEIYKEKGYSVLAYTDHEHLIDNSHLNDENFLTITSAELAVKEFPRQSTLVNYKMRVAHFNIYALNPSCTLTPCYSSVYDHYVNAENKDLIKFDGEYERVYSKEGVNALIKECKEKGFLVSYNHPTWSLENATDYLSYENLDFVEIYNHSCCASGRPDDEHAFDDFLRSGKKIYCTCCDDNHNLGFPNPFKNDSFGGFTMINADKLDYGSIMSALQNGEFYASTAPLIYSLTIDGNKVSIETSPVKMICLTTEGRRSKVAYATDENGVKKAEFEVDKKDGYFRITLIDFEGKKAYTQAYEI